jgi:integrase
VVQGIVQNPPLYLVERAGTFHLRVAIPPRVRKLNPQLPREAKRSLRTDSKRQAVAWVARQIEIIHALQNTEDSEDAWALYQLLTNVPRSSFPLGELITSKFVPERQIIQSVLEEVALSDIEESGLLLSVAWCQFVESKSWTKKAAETNERMFENLLFFLGDVPVQVITKKDIKAALMSVAGLPKRNLKAYKGVSLSDITGLDSIPDDDLVSGKYVRDHLKLLQSFFSSYLHKETEILSASPTDGVTWQYSDNRFAALSDSYVHDLLIKSQSKPDWFQWFFRIALYTGARRSEIAALRKDSFKVDQDTGRHYIFISQGKTTAAIRQVPLHLALLELGLLDWVAQQPDNIFSRASSNPNRVTELFGSLLDVNSNDFGEKFVFHSLRHTFVTKARSKGLSDPVIQQLVGHSKRGAGITDRYTHVFPIAALLPVIDAIDY